MPDPKMYSDDRPVVSPPSTATVPENPRIVILDSKGVPLVRKIGYR